MINAPVVEILSPVGTETPLISTSQFTGSGTHKSTTFMIYANGVNVINYISTKSLYLFRIPLGVLQSNTEYTIEVSYSSENESSSFTTVTYNTEDISLWKYVEKPTITVEDVSGQPLVLRSSNISAVGGSPTHISTSWQLIVKCGHTVIQYLPESSDLTSLVVPRTLLVDGETYLAKCRHIGESGFIRSDYAELEFSIANSGTPVAPTVSVSGEPSSVTGN